MPQLIYSPWAKFCGKGQDAAAKQVCFTGKDARTEAGQPVIAAALIEPDGEPKKLFRITLPSPLQLQYGTRVIVDQQAPLTGPFFTCFANGCMADYEATPDLIGKLKHGQMLTIQAINLAGAAISFPLPLVDFAKANEGPPTDPKVFEEQQKKLQEELQKRADEARKKLEASGASLRRPLPRTNRRAGARSPPPVFSSFDCFTAQPCWAVKFLRFADSDGGGSRAQPANSARNRSRRFSLTGRRGNLLPQSLNAGSTPSHDRTVRSILKFGISRLCRMLPNGSVKGENR